VIKSKPYLIFGAAVSLALFSAELIAGNSVDNAIRSQSCGFWKQMDHPSPEELAAEFVKKDSEGEFMMMNPWFDTATLCPHRETIPDHAFVIKNPKLARISETPDVADFEVTYQQIGTLISLTGSDAGRKGFVPAVSEKKRKFAMVKTSFGWRMVNPVLADGQFVSARAVLQDGRVKAEDRKILLQLAN
jgi:hypothetical protein